MDQYWKQNGYDVCDVTLSVYPHRVSLKNMPGDDGNQTYKTSGFSGAIVNFILWSEFHSISHFFPGERQL